MHARAIRPSRGPADRRRSVAALLSAAYPGLGQAFNRDPRFVIVFALPLTALALLAIGLVQVFGARLLIAFFKPDTILALLVLNAVLLTWRLVAVGQAFAAGAPGPVGRLGVIGLALATVLTLAPHSAASFVGWRLYETTSAICVSCRTPVARGPATPNHGGGEDSIFAGLPFTQGPSEPEPVAPRPTPQIRERVNILLLGIDSRPGRRQALTDTIIVASIDPVGRFISMLSVPRDMVNVPLPDGTVWEQKINSLQSHVDSNPNDPRFAWANGDGTRALQDALGELLDIPIHYYATVDLPGFIRVVDALGGIDVNVERRLHAPSYSDFDLYGFSVDEGRHHFDGREALAYARIRKVEGESDFTRAERQQQVLVAIRAAALEGGALGLLGRLDGLLRAVGDSVRTDVPPERFTDFALLAEEIEGGRVANAVIQAPLIATEMHEEQGSIEIPDVEAIRLVADGLFPQEGVRPRAWPDDYPNGLPAPRPSDPAASHEGQTPASGSDQADTGDAP